MARSAGSTRVAVALALLAVAMGPVAHAEEDTVVEEILAILREKEHISDAQYESLKARARAEAEQQARAAVAAATAPPPAGSKPAAPSAPAPGPRLEASWRDGLLLETTDRAFQVRAWSRFMNDWALLLPDDDVVDAIPDADGSGTEFRRARVGMSGLAYEHFGFRAEYEFADAEVGLRDVYFEVLDLGDLPNVRIGHFKEPISFDELVGVWNTTFLERALPNVLIPSRNTGVMLSDTALDRRVTWAIGAFRFTDSASANGFSDDPLYDVTARVTGLPWYEDDGRRLLHLGLGVSQQFRDRNDVRFRARPEIGLAPIFVDTGDFAAHDVLLLDPELALVAGPFWLQAEYVHAFVDGAGDAGDPGLWSAYAQVGWFLTGESRPYDRVAAVFDRVTPRESFYPGRGTGAWELVARVSHLDLDGGGVDGGTLTDGTLGVNWYLNRSFRWSAEYVLGRLQDVGTTHQLGMRFWVQF